jgi:carboxypeptidase T
MKYLRTIVALSLIVALTGTDENALSGEVDSSGHNSVSLQKIKFFRVYFDNLGTAHDIVIAMDAVESKYEKGYVIVQVTNNEEYKRLRKTGLKIKKIADPFKDKIEAIQQAALLETTGIPNYPCYRTVEETFATAESIAANHPDLATWTDEGNSWEKENSLGGYDMKVLRLTNSAIAGPKPKIFLTSDIHAREYTTAELVTRLAEYLVDNYGTDADATWMLDHHEIHMMLHANPDGRKQAETGLSWRKNTNDNYCTFWPNSRGADLNRNFEFKWNCCGGSSDNECDPTYHGLYAASEPETDAVQDYVFAQFLDQRGPNDDDAAPDYATGLYIDVHSHGRLVLWPWGWTPDPSPNATQLQTLGRKFAYFNGHEPKQGYGLYPTDGTTTTFTYGELGIASYTFELGTEFFEDCSYFENNILNGNTLALLYAIKVARTPYMTPAGPEAINLALDISSSVPSGTIVTLSATMDDTRYNNSNGTEPSQNIAAAEYYVDVPPWVTDPTPVAIPMSPSDESLDSTVEAVEAAIDTTGWSEEQHIVFVRGQDADGNWGPFSAIFLIIENQPCNDSSECDDGLFCNGAETCVDNICQPGTDPCPGQQCNEDFDQCVAAPVFEDDFESGNAQGWDLYAPGSTASTGDWVIGDPIGTVSGSDQAQPEDTYAGTGCIFTAQNSSLGVDDVDGGVVYLVLPVIDLSAADSAELEYVRWFYNRDAGVDAGDFFVAQVSDDNGTNWVDLETLDTSQSANTWTSKAFMLESYINLTSTVRVRFGAADGPSLGNIIEAALDNVKVWVYGGCETDPECDDGLFCNGEETCVSGTCQPGSDPCLGQLCDETGDVCVDCLVDGNCDDGLYCNGAEICISGVCQASVNVSCDDSIACTTDSCNETTDTCDNIPDDGDCDDGVFCNGAETCDTQLGCQSGSDPCPGQSCDETGDVCVDCLEDGNCDDGLYCNGAETCVSGTCQPGSPPNCDDSVSCTDDSCNEGTDSCDHTAKDSLCDNGLFCDGTETCDPLLDCQSGIDPCNGQACDEDNDSCVECGNGICEETYGEHCSNCPQDCPGDGFKGECCGNEICEKFEGKRGTCPEDCG